MVNLLEDEAVVVGGSNHSHATADLYDAIAAGDYPEWKLCIQVRRARSPTVLSGGRIASTISDTHWPATSSGSGNS